MQNRSPSALPPAFDEPRWVLPVALPARSLQGGAMANLPPELLAVLLRRGVEGPEALADLLDPPPAPDPLLHFADLSRALIRLETACRQGEAVAICGDYDADGMTSTALLTGVLSRLGARPKPAIPRRMEEGYGLNVAMVERLAAEGIGLLITVDNGVSALAALDRAAELAVEVILTDHHSLPPQLPPHLALLHPALTPADSPYRGLAGVGLAHVLAMALCQRLGRRDGQAISLNLFCIGTIADMAPLTGVNRRWLLDGLPRLAASPLPGLKALQQLAGLGDQPLDAEAVAFKLAPRINAVGRLGDPLLVVDLLTTEDPDRAMDLARRCEALNRQRRELCDAIEAEALALLEADGPQWPGFLLLAQGHWHHGVIGIVAARLVERCGRPVALLAGEGGGQLRASVRAPRGFRVDGALSACADLLERFGGHPAAGGFTVQAAKVRELKERLEALAQDWLGEQGSGRKVEPEALLPLARIDRDFLMQLKRLEPFGIGHGAPVFWSRHCQISSCRLLRGGHLELQLAQGSHRLRAMAWRWEGSELPTGAVDVAFRLRMDHWQGEARLQLEVVALRPSSGDTVVLMRRQRTYWCQKEGDGVLIRNDAGEQIRAQNQEWLEASQQNGTEQNGTEQNGTQQNGEQRAIGTCHPYLQSLFRDAAVALGLTA